MKKPKQQKQREAVERLERHMMFTQPNNPGWTAIRMAEAARLRRKFGMEPRE